MLLIPGAWTETLLGEGGGGIRGGRFLSETFRVLGFRIAPYQMGVGHFAANPPRPYYFVSTGLPAPSPQSVDERPRQWSLCSMAPRMKSRQAMYLQIQAV